MPFKPARGSTFQLRFPGPLTDDGWLTTSLDPKQDSAPVVPHHGLLTTTSSDWSPRKQAACYPPPMERPRFEVDHELVAKQRANHERAAHDAAMAEYRQTTRWMLRAAGKLVLSICAFIALLLLLGWLFRS